MDVASDYCGNVKDQRQFNNLQGSAAHVESVNESRQVINVPMQLTESVVIVSTVSRATRDIRIRLKQHKWSILAFVCGVVLALVIVVPVMVSKFSSTATGRFYCFLLIIFKTYFRHFFYIHYSFEPMSIIPFF